jgi:hypothetical protein
LLQDLFSGPAFDNDNCRKKNLKHCHQKLQFREDSSNGLVAKCCGKDITEEWN